MIRTRTLALLGLAFLSACAGQERPPVGQPTRPAEAFSLRPVRFSAMPGWTSADLAPALAAFRRSCMVWRNQTPSQGLSGGRYGGQIAFWLPACAAADSVAAGGERAFFESYFTANEVRGAGEARLTGYYEPVIQVRRTPAPPYTAPLLKKPYDMVSVDLRAFADAYDDGALRGAPRALTGQLNGSTVRPYPKRDAINPRPDQVIAYAHPADLYNLQVQGSGRIEFEDGTDARAAYAAQNGYKWNSALQCLPDGQRTWAAAKTYMDANGPAETTRVLDCDPSYVFFAQEPLTDPSLGPRGAANVSLTPMGSIAVDPAYHPYGALLFVDGTYQGAPFRRLLVAQDTGGAIKRGPLRGDVFFGSGADAGAAAELMNAPARMWTLLPNGAPTS
jgi:membrane-bound lytic murein transglycosylase A